MKSSQYKQEKQSTARHTSVDDTLIQRLRLATRDDLRAVLETDLRISPAKYKSANHEEMITAVSEELRSAAGHTLRNLSRKPHELPYKRILVDVADKLAPGLFKWSDFSVDGPETETEIENYINDRFQLLVEQYLKSLKESDKVKLQKRVEKDLRAQGLPEHVVTASLSALAAGTVSGVLIGPFLATTLFGSFWTGLTGLSLGKLVVGRLVSGGPIGIAVGTAVVLMGPSYSKTIPAVTRLIIIRLNREAKDRLKKGSS
jgi:uncharacterized protein YaaW (UPF0174 family)